MRAGGWALIGLCLAVSACDRPRTPESTGQADVDEVRLPNLDTAAPSVQAQIRAKYDALRQALSDADVTSVDRANSYGELGRVLMAARFDREAASCFEQAQALVPGAARWPYLLGHARLRGGNRAGAIEAFEQTLAITPGDTAALIWLAETRLDDGDANAAGAAFERALTASPRSAAASFGAGRAALARQAYQDAVRWMEQALAIEPAASAIHYPLAQAYRALGDNGKADEHLRRRGSAYPTLADPALPPDSEVLDSAVALEGHGMDALKAGNLPEAEATFRRGLALAPDDTSLRYWLGATLFASGRATESAREFQQVIAAQPGHADAHFSLGAIADASGRRAEALAHYRAAVAANPMLPEARLRLADTLRATGANAEAIEHYRAAVDLDPRLADAWTGGARALIALGRRKDADEWLARAMRIFPERQDLRALRQ